MSDLPKIGTRELDALCELARRQADKGIRAPYYWHKASMQKLAAHGLVEPFLGYGSEAQPAWRITQEGRRRVPHAQ